MKRMMKIARISDPTKTEEFEYLDLGDVKKEKHYESHFVFADRSLKNVAHCEDDASGLPDLTQRYARDAVFLALNDYDIFSIDDLCEDNLVRT